MSERKAWTQEQDQALRQLFENRGITKWSEIARMMETHFHIEGRNGKQCRQRYHNHLDLTIRHDQWTRKQEECLCELHNTIGNRWAEISRAIPGRSENCVKNKFYSMIRRGLKHLNLTIRSSLKRYKELDIAVINKIVEVCELNYKKRNKNNKMIEAMEMKKAILNCGMKDKQDNEEEFQIIKALVDRIKDFSRTVTINKKRDSNLSQSKGSASEDISVQIDQEEYRDKFPVKKSPILERFVSGQFKPHFQLEPQIRFDHSYAEMELHQEDQLLPEPKIPLAKFPSFHRNFSLLSNKSIGELSNEPNPELILRDSMMKSSFEFCEFDNNARSPRPTIFFESPYFDQLKGNSFNNWAQFYQH